MIAAGLALSPVAGGAAGFLLGAIVGSFTSTLLLRWPEGRSATAGRSECDGCGRTLRAWELVPLLSFVAARGRCRTCGNRIERAHFLVELASGAIGALSLALHPDVQGLATALFGWWLLLIAALDLEHHWLPDRLTLPLLPVGLMVATAGVGAEFADRIIGALCGYVLLAIIRLLYRQLRGREGMGGGDPKLLAALGAWLGWQQLPMVLLGAGLLGLGSVLAMQMRGHRVSGSDRLPLGSLMAVAAWPIWLVMLGS